MKDLANREAIKKIDPQNTYDSTLMLSKQLSTAWAQVTDIQIPQEYSKVNNIVFCGMGASIYGALVTKALFGGSIKYPIEIVSDYHLPPYVDDTSLVVLTSYSGTTEEVLSCAQEAKDKNAKMLVLTKGGGLSEFAKTNKVPSYIFDGAMNPSSVPRLGNGYTILGLMGLLHKAGIITVDEEKLAEAISYLQDNTETIRQKAQNEAQQFVGKVPIIFAAEHLSGNAQIFRNQFNEKSKTFSAYYLIPDLNHHLMEGLQFPTSTNLVFIILHSKNYSSKIQKRVALTIDVVKQNKHEVFESLPSGLSPYHDFLETLLYGSYLTFFLAVIYDQNPAINPWVDYFKKKLA